MTAQLLPCPMFKGWDNNGNPLANGQLFTYQAGTSTPQVSFTDASQGQQQTNPVILNARGEAQIWLGGGLLYKLTLADSTGNQIWTVDQIPGGIPFTQQAIGQILYPRTVAESAAGVTPTDFSLQPYDIRRYGALQSNTSAQNVASLNAAIAVAQNDVGAANLGGVVITIPASCHYGYKVTNKTTWPQLSGPTPITVYDYSQGESYSGYPTAYDGNQVRLFSYTPETTSVGTHDGNNFWFRGSWAPNFIVGNDMDLSGARAATDNRRARYLFANQGNITWGIGQGVGSSASLTSEQLSNFFIQKFAAPGDTLSSLNSLLIERITGNWMFNAGANLPGANYHFVATVAGFAQGLFETDFSTTSVIYLRNSSGSSQDVGVVNRAGQACINVLSQGDAVTWDLANRRMTNLSTQTVLTQPTYGATITINNDLGDAFVITATNNTAFTVSNPSGTTPTAAQRIRVTIRNTSGGALGAVTWSSAYKLAAWTSPATANSRSIDFQYYPASSAWVEISRTPNDVPN